MEKMVNKEMVNELLKNLGHQNISDFLTTHADKKIVLIGYTDGKLVNENNEIRAFVS